MTNNLIITIGRQYGSGGREIGKILSERLNIPFYDKELLTVAAQKSGICEQLFETYDEKPTGSLLYMMGAGGFSPDSLPVNHRLFLAQFETIRSIAQEHSCVIIGRCADYALAEYPGCINAFVHAPLKDRIQRVKTLYDMTAAEAEAMITKVDKKRASYYNFYTNRKWGMLENYSLTINSSEVGTEGAASLIEKFIQLKNEKK